MQNINIFFNINLKWLIPFKVSKIKTSFILKLNNSKTAIKIINKSMVIGYNIYKCVLYKKKCKIK